MTVRETLEKIIPEVYLLKGSRNNLLPSGGQKRVRVSSRTLKKRIKETSKQLATNINRFTRRRKNKKGGKQKH